LLVAVEDATSVSAALMEKKHNEVIKDLAKILSL